MPSSRLAAAARARPRYSARKASSRWLVGRTDPIQTEAPRLGIDGLPDSDSSRQLLRDDLDGTVTLEGPLHSRPGRARHDRGIEGVNALERVRLRERMIRVGDVSQVLFAGQAVEVELGGVRKEELVARRIQNQLRHRESVAVLVRLLYPHESLELGRVQAIQQPLLL